HRPHRRPGLAARLAAEREARRGQKGDVAMEGMPGVVLPTGPGRRDSPHIAVRSGWARVRAPSRVARDAAISVTPGAPTKRAGSNRSEARHNGNVSRRRCSLHSWKAQGAEGRRANRLDPTRVAAAGGEGAGPGESGAERLFDTLLV